MSKQSRQRAFKPVPLRYVRLLPGHGPEGDDLWKVSGERGSEVELINVRTAVHLVIYAAHTYQDTECKRLSIQDSQAQHRKEVAQILGKHTAHPGRNHR
jgi:hypothetical protein